MKNTTDIIDTTKHVDKIGGVSEVSGKLSELTSNLSTDLVEWIMRFSFFEWIMIIGLISMLIILMWLKSKVKKNLKRNNVYMN